jgi:hypothetical protein
MALITVGSADDMHSCLVLCAIYPEEPQDTPESYKPIHTKYGYYVPLPNDQQWMTDYILALLNLELHQPNGRRHVFCHQHATQELDVPRLVQLSDGPIAALAMSGLRYVTMPGTDQVRECYVQWENLINRDFPMSHSTSNDSLRVHRIKRGIGCLYSQWCDESNTPVTLVVFIEAEIELHPLMLRINAYGHLCNAEAPQDYWSPRAQREKPVWEQAFLRAQSNFLQLASDGVQLEPTFAEVLQGGDWRAAFDTVSTADELTQACLTLRPSEFNKGRSARARGNEMVRTYLQEARPNAANIIALWPEASNRLKEKG